jgi:hypothetical protein
MGPESRAGAGLTSEYRLMQVITEANVPSYDILIPTPVAAWDAKPNLR